MSFSEFIDGLQLPTLRRVSLSQWPSAYRRVLMDESIASLCQFARLAKFDEILDSDESAHRLQTWFSNSDRNDNIDDSENHPTPVLSQFDPVLHLIISGLDLRQDAQKSESREPSGATFWPTEIVTSIAESLHRFFGESAVEIACLRLCLSLCCHSDEVAQNCVLHHPDLMSRLETLTLSLTFGTEMHRKRVSLHSRPSNDSANIESELAVKTALFQFVSCGGSRSMDQFFKWGDGMVLVVLVRQCLMEPWISSQRVMSITPAPTHCESPDEDYSKFLEDVIGAVPSSAAEEKNSVISDHEMGFDVPQDVPSSVPWPSVDLCRIEALKVLRVWSEQDVWREDQQSLFSVFLEWINDVLVNDMKDGRQTSFISMHITVLNSLIPYLWTSLLSENNSDLSV